MFKKQQLSKKTIFLIITASIALFIFVWWTQFILLDWSYFWLDGLKGLIISLVSFITGLWVFNKYIYPRMVVQMGTDVIRLLKEDGEIKPQIETAKILIEKGKKVMEKLEPIVEKAKNLDLEKVSEDLKPLLEAVKKIDPKTVEEVIKSIKELADAMKGTLTKPKIPEPD